MLRLRRDQPSLWESILPEEILKLSEELTKVDILLEDERFFAPFREKFSCQWGRPTVPIATYLRLMYLKFRYKLGYKALFREVQDSFTGDASVISPSMTLLLMPAPWLSSPVNMEKLRFER